MPKAPTPRQQNQQLRRELRQTKAHARRCESVMRRAEKFLNTLGQDGAWETWDSDKAASIEVELSNLCQNSPLRKKAA